jgi:hypothetical protein
MYAQQAVAQEWLLRGLLETMQAMVLQAVLAVVVVALQRALYTILKMVVTLLQTQHIMAALVALA